MIDRVDRADRINPDLHIVPGIDGGGDTCCVANCPNVATWRIQVGTTQMKEVTYLCNSHSEKARREIQMSQRPFIARDTKEPLVVFGGYHIAEGGGIISNPVPMDSKKPVARIGDVELLTKHGPHKLLEMGYHGSIDRLNTSGLWPEDLSESLSLEKARLYKTAHHKVHDKFVSLHGVEYVVDQGYQGLVFDCKIRLEDDEEPVEIKCTLRELKDFVL